MGAAPVVDFQDASRWFIRRSIYKRSAGSFLAFMSNAMSLHARQQFLLRRNRILEGEEEQRISLKFDDVVRLSR
jgi:hypothetical protein